MIHFNRITAAAVLGIAAFLAAGTCLSRGRTVSSEENRALAGFPKASFSSMADGS